MNDEDAEDDTLFDKDKNAIEKWHLFDTSNSDVAMSFTGKKDAAESSQNAVYVLMSLQGDRYRVSDVEFINFRPDASEHSSSNSVPIEDLENSFHDRGQRYLERMQGFRRLEEIREEDAKRRGDLIEKDDGPRRKIASDVKLRGDDEGESEARKSKRRMRHADRDEGESVSRRVKRERAPDFNDHFSDDDQEVVDEQPEDRENDSDAFEESDEDQIALSRAGEHSKELLEKAKHGSLPTHVKKEAEDDSDDDLEDGMDSDDPGLSDSEDDQGTINVARSTTAVNNPTSAFIPGNSPYRVKLYMLVVTVKYAIIFILANTPYFVFIFFVFPYLFVIVAIIRKHQKLKSRRFQ